MRVFLKECYFDLATMKVRYLLTTCLIALTLALPASGYLVSRVLGQVSDNLSHARTISVFIESRPEMVLQQLTTTLARYDQIALANLVSVPVDPTLTGNESAQVVEVTPTAGLSAVQFAGLVDQLRSLPAVEMVSWSEDTVTRNRQASGYARLFAAISLAIAAILFTLITSWLIRRNIRSSKEIVDIKHDLGATPAQIRGPMLLKGILLGTVAGIGGYALAAYGAFFLTEMVDITILKIELRPRILQIFLYLSVVITFSYVITRMAFRKIFFYIYQ